MQRRFEHCSLTLLQIVNPQTTAIRGRIELSTATHSLYFSGLQPIGSETGMSLRAQKSVMSKDRDTGRLKYNFAAWILLQ